MIMKEKAKGEEHVAKFGDTLFWHLANVWVFLSAWLAQFSLSPPKYKIYDWKDLPTFPQWIPIKYRVFQNIYYKLMGHVKTADAGCLNCAKKFYMMVMTNCVAGF